MDHLSRKEIVHLEEELRKNQFHEDDQVLDRCLENPHESVLDRQRN